MEDVFALLSINKSALRDFPLQAERLVDHQTELVINRNMRSLKEFEERMLSDKPANISEQSIDDVIYKVVKNANKNNNDDSIWSIRELRIISYYLIKLQSNDNAYEYALRLLGRNWRNMFFNGLAFYCLDQWNAIDPILRKKTCELLRNKLAKYTEGNKKYMAMKNHANLFDESGPKRLSALIDQKKTPIEDAPSFFNNRPSSLSQSYYSDVIVNYCEKKMIMDIDVIEEIFEKHNLERTKKLVLADLVIRVNDYGDEIQRTMLCKFANRMLGDITLGVTWAPFNGATEQDANKLKRAKQLVNLWFNRKIIETFFEICVQDRDRKEFWLNYVDKLSGFRIVGSAATKRLLQSDNRISNIFFPYFIETNSATSQTSALVLFIRNKMLVEFSDTGALYAYNQNHSMANHVLKKNTSISNTKNLKITSMWNLVYVSEWGNMSLYEEGRMPHMVNWQMRLSYWLEQMVLSQSNTVLSKLDTKDEEVFKAKPVKKEDLKPRIKRKYDVPEYLAEGFKQRTVETSSATNKDNEIKYEYNVPMEKSSKWMFGLKCRISGNSEGFYLNINKGNKFVFLCPHQNTLGLLGSSIWIKRSINGWFNVILASQETELSIGYIKETSNEILFKKNRNDDVIKKININ